MESCRFVTTADQAEPTAPFTTALDFNHDKTDVINRVLNHEYQLAFFLGPVRTDVIRAIADAGDRMPRKSTYFYPKPPSGLVFRRLE